MSAILAESAGGAKLAYAISLGGSVNGIVCSFSAHRLGLMLL